MKEVGDPLLLLEKVMQWIGMVTLVPKVRPRYYMIAVVVEHLIYVNCYLATTLYIYGDHPFFDKMESFQCFLSLFHMMAKYINLHYNTGPYRKLSQTCRKMWEEAKKRPENRELMAEIWNETEMSVKVIILMFAGAVPTNCLMTLIYNMRVDSEKRETLYMVWAPVPDDSWYWTACFYQGFFMAASLNTLAVTLCACYVHCLQVAGQMRILCHMLKSDKVDIKACAILHQNILQYFKQVKDYFAGQLFLEVLVSSVQNSMRLYMCMRQQRRDTNLENEPRSEPHSEWNVEATERAVNGNPSTSTHQLTTILGPSRETIRRHLKSFGRNFRSCRFVLHDLTVAKAQRRLVSQNDLKAVGAIFICILCMSGPFIDCLCGHVISENSEKLFMSSYQNAWYNLPEKDKKGIAILMTMSTPTIRLHYRGLLDFSMERYSMVMQATYSYVTLLKGADVG